MRPTRNQWRAVAWALATGLALPTLAQESAAPEADTAPPDTPQAEASWRLSGSGEAWVYGTRNGVLSTSLLNPGNRVEIGRAHV